MYAPPPVFGPGAVFVYGHCSCGGPGECFAGEAFLSLRVVSGGPISICPLLLFISLVASPARCSISPDGLPPAARFLWRERNRGKSAAGVFPCTPGAAGAEAKGALTRRRTSGCGTSACRLRICLAIVVCFSGWLSVDRQCFPSPVSQTEAYASVWRGGMTEHSRVIAALTLTVSPVPQIEADASI